MPDTIIERCEAKGLRMTEQRRTIAGVLEAADDHPDVEELYARASAASSTVAIVRRCSVMRRPLASQRSMMDALICPTPVTSLEMWSSARRP